MAIELESQFFGPQNEACFLFVVDVGLFSIMFWTCLFYLQKTAILTNWPQALPVRLPLFTFNVVLSRWAQLKNFRFVVEFGSNVVWTLF